MPDNPRAQHPATPSPAEEAASAAPRSGSTDGPVPQQRSAEPAGSELPTVIHAPVTPVQPGFGAMGPPPAGTRPAGPGVPPAGPPRQAPGRFAPGPRPGTGPIPGRPATAPFPNRPATGAFPNRPAPASPRPLAGGARPAAAASGSAPAATATDADTDTTAAPAKSSDITVNKVIAGAGAAATSAVVGSYLGAAGTVMAAALGSVVSMVGASVYQSYLDRTRDTVKAKIRLPGSQTVEVDEPVEVPAARTAADGAPPTELLVAPAGDRAGGRSAAVSPVAVRSARRPLFTVAAGVVLAFVIGMLVVTGVEWVKGSPLSRSDSGSGTSVGRVLGGEGDAAAEPSTTDDDGQSTDDSRSDDSTTSEPSGRTSTREPFGSAEPPSATSGPTTRPNSSTSPAPTSTTPSTTAVVPPVGSGQGATG
ncbi:hypothetical protein [Pseudonocardia sp.]|uniref:hypothetical protein n=1 Tax=Pseudonocardia sp. TaxID=60912 RepID=UPI003D0E0396